MRRAAKYGLVLLIVNSAYLAAFAQASIFYEANVLLHLGLGLALAVAAIGWLHRYPRECGAFIASAAAAMYLVFRGNLVEHRWALALHILLALAALMIIGLRYRIAFVGVACVLAGLALAVVNRPHQRIENPPTAPLSMDEEGAGAKSPFAPSSAQTNTGNIIPSNFFMDSEACGQCHKDIYEQWKSSMHHFASFNNQFYRKSIEYMQDVAGTRPSKWCAGCHDHAVFFNGRFDRPIREQIDTPEAQAGLGCMSCHAIVHVGSSMGNADFRVEYPPLHELASSHNRYIRALDYFLTYLNPKPHKRTFLKPFMADQSAEFCAACHKVHLDFPVNNYRWLRGFNDYDNWQASGVSGQGARSFYYPAKSQTCADCHMPLTPSRDPGNRDGKVHSHRFAAANTAVPYANQDPVQLRAAEEFLKSGFITVDIFAVSPATETGGQPMRRRSDAVQASSTFAVGEEAEQNVAAVLRDVGKVAAPVDASGVRLEQGSTARVDVVVRTRKIGHFFPGGTVDAFDTWLELQAQDGAGRTIFWSGGVTDGGKGPVDPGAHFYKSYQLDGEGNAINKRNAWQARSLLYVRLIPPGAADTAHFLVKIPKGAMGPIRFTAKLNYRKFSWYYTQFSYAGKPKPGQNPALLGLNHNGMEYDFSPELIPANVSGKIRGRTPDLPVITLAQASASVPLGTTVWTPVVRKQDRERWNDWGIGLLLQGDLKGAEYAFRRVTEAEPQYADGWLNVGRALVQEGETEAARPFVEKALALEPNLARGHFFLAMIQKAAGDYDGALRSLRRTEQQYPRDRVTTNQIGRILFLKRQYGDAAQALRKTLAVDPEDVQAHYTLMLCYRGLGRMDAAGREQKLFQRFKADEASQAITAKQRLLSPEDNNERQSIHDHVSAPIADSAGDLRASRR
ncbi:MAG TPA: tetratricopeptide repeat protein [Candidatus Acidoferrales bacterium]|nr:tetratricopeptide repeat protein [Candidatus Acidoferrales bacterium]